MYLCQHASSLFVRKVYIYRQLWRFPPSPLPSYSPSVYRILSAIDTLVVVVSTPWCTVRLRYLMHTIYVVTSCLLLHFGLTSKGGDQGAKHPEDDQRKNSTTPIQATPPLGRALCHHRAHGQGEVAPPHPLGWCGVVWCGVVLVRCDTLWCSVGVVRYSAGPLWCIRITSR